jgi:hypothetical protein
MQHDGKKLGVNSKNGGFQTATPWFLGVFGGSTVAAASPRSGQKAVLNFF